MTKGKTRKTQIMIFDKNEILDLIDIKKAKEIFTINQSSWKKNDGNVFNIFSKDSTNLLSKIEKNAIILNKICDFTLGISPYDKHKGHRKDDIENRIFHAFFKKDKTYKRLLKGKDIIRYGIFWNGKQWIKYGNWLGRPREQRFFSEDHIIVRQIISGNPPRIYAAFCNIELYNTQIGFNLLLKPKQDFDLKYILAILNSKLMTYYHSEKFLDKSKDVFQKILIQNAKKFPIKRSSDTKIEKKIVGLVDEMIDFTNILHEIGNKKTSRKAGIEEKLSITDSKIDDLVFEIYGFTLEEISIVEESLK